MVRQVGQTEFKLASNPTLDHLVTFSLGLASAGQVIIWALFAAGIFGIEVAISAAVVVAAPVAITWKLRSYFRGTIRLTAERLEIHTGAVKHLYRWSDIDHVGLDSLESSSALHRLSITGRLFPDQLLVAIGLNKYPRVGLLRNRIGTDESGIPSPFAKTIRLRLEDPEGFITGRPVSSGSPRDFVV